LGHSCETGWNKHDSSYYSKQNSEFYNRVKFYLYYLQVYDKNNQRPNFKVQIFNKTV
jgi:hypothetical protein